MSSRQASTPRVTARAEHVGRIAPQQVWPTLSPQQRHVVLQRVVAMCQECLVTSSPNVPKEVSDVEHAG
jgi:hypothetical protein